jgi:putative ABC transport system ATP-binding protein
MNEIIRLENVVKMMDSGNRAVNGVSLLVGKGKCVRISGAAGSGKTTLARLIAGLEPVSSGSIYVLDEAVHQINADRAADFRNRHMGMLEEKPAFMDSLSLLENVALPLTIRGVKARQREKAAKEQLKNLGILYAAGARPFRLSALEAQLASVARMLAAQPQVLLVDDVGAGLSQKDAAQLGGILYALSRFGGYTVLEFASTAGGLMAADSTFTIDHGMIQEEIQ